MFSSLTYVSCAVATTAVPLKVQHATHCMRILPKNKLRRSNFFAIVLLIIFFFSPGIGPKTALRLLKIHGNLENIVAALKKVNTLHFC